MSENDSKQTDDAPDGAESDIASKTRAERTELEQAIYRRNLALEERRKAEAEAEELRAKLAALQSQAPAKKTDPALESADVPDYFRSFMADMDAKFASLSESFTKHQGEAAFKAVEREVLARVPERNRVTASALLRDLGVDFTKEGAAADALAKLQEQHSVVMVDPSRSSQPRAPQKRPDGSIDFSSFRTFADVPDAYKSAAMKDPKEFARLTGNTQGRADGLNI